MHIEIIATGSTGNCYFIRQDNKESGLLIDPGISGQQILKSMDYNLNKIEGCLVSHNHQDHSKALPELIKANVPCYISQGCVTDDIQDRINKPGQSFLPGFILTPGEQRDINRFSVMPFEVMHDALNTLGFLIRIDCEKILYVTDTSYIPYKFFGLTHIMVECNYEKNLLEKNVMTGVIPRALQIRIIKNHMELDSTRKFLWENCNLSMLKKLYLIHGSRKNLSSNFAEIYIREALKRKMGRLFKEEII